MEDSSDVLMIVATAAAFADFARFSMWVAPLAMW